MSGLRRLVHVAALGGCVLVPPAAWAQSTATPGATAFIERARAATEKYQDRRAAILDGYRPIGRDFPAMGEHWIRIGLVFDGKTDPSRPEVLNYVIVAGQPKLVGLGYAVPLLAGEVAPDAPAGRDAWHDHFRTVEDETVLPHLHEHGAAKDGARLAMLHTWIWSPNPDGVFAADNWALSYVRLGLPVPVSAPPAAAKALSLLSGGVDYFEMQFAAAEDVSARERPKMRAALEHARAKAESIVRNRRGVELSPSDLSALADAWEAAQRAGSEVQSPCVVQGSQKPRRS